MRLSSLDIKKQEFKRILRGYDPVEVETFLEMVSDEYENILSANEEYKKEIEALRHQLKDYKDIESNLKSSLVRVQEDSRRTKESSRSEAEIILKEARLQAERIKSGAKADITKLNEEINSLKSQKNVFATRLRHMLESQVELIKILESDDLKPNNVPRQPRKIQSVRPEPVKIREDKIPQQRPEISTKKAQVKPEKADFKSGRAGFKSEQSHYRPEKAGFKPEKPVNKKQMPLKKVSGIQKEDKKIIDGFDLIDKMLEEEKVEHRKKIDSKQKSNRPPDDLKRNLGRL